MVKIAHIAKFGHQGVPYGQALTGSDFSASGRVGSGRVVNLKVGLPGTLGLGSDKFSVVNWPS